MRTEQRVEALQREEELKNSQEVERAADGNGYRVNEALTALLKQEPGVEAAGIQSEVETQAGTGITPEAEAPLAEMSELPEAEGQMDLFEAKTLRAPVPQPPQTDRPALCHLLAVEFKDQLYIIDQHAAHEKVLYEKTMNSLKTREYTCQQIHPPIILTLGSREALMLEKNMKIFTDIGFEIEPFGGKEYAVRGVPDNLFSIARKELLMEMLDSLSEDAQARNADMIYEKGSIHVLQGAVKGHDVLSAAEADALIDQLLGAGKILMPAAWKADHHFHGKYELEKKV